MLFELSRRADYTEEMKWSRNKYVFIERTKNEEIVVCEVTVVSSFDIVHLQNRRTYQKNF